MAFSHISGQTKAITVLRNALRHQRVPQAYVFAGPEGVGKKFTALMLAKALNCHELEDDACDRCNSCHKIDEGIHPDVRVIAPEGQFIKIDQIRALQKDAGYKPFEGRKKVYILDQAEAMRAEAANSLLKTLEEPSTDCVLILITANVYALLPTVMSRCQFVRFAALGIEALAALLMREKQVEAERARVMASLAEGCPGRALAMDAQETLDKRQRMEHLLAMLSSGLQDVRVLFDQVEQLSRDKAAIQEFLDILLVWYRDMHLLREHGDARLVANADAAPRLKEAAFQRPASHIRRLFEIVYQTKMDLLRNANLQLALEVMLISLTEVYNDRNRWR
jgi:DNA polymerase-3 subunit delta'